MKNSSPHNPTSELIRRAHSANSLAKIASGSSKERLYRAKTDAVLQFAKTFPEKIWFTSLERKPPGKWLFAITGIGIGSIHLLSESPLEILNLIQPASFLDENNYYSIINNA